MNPNDVAPAIVGSIFFLSVAVVLVLRGPIGKALARRLEGRAGGEDASRVAELEDRVVRLERVNGRLAELEERIDFAERMLAGRRDAGRLERSVE